MNNNTFSAPAGDPFADAPPPPPALAAERPGVTTAYDSDPFGNVAPASLSSPSSSPLSDDFEFPSSKPAASLSGGFSSSRFVFGDAYEFPFDDDDDPFGDDFDAQFDLSGLTSGASGGSMYYAQIPADIRAQVEAKGASKTGAILMLVVLLLLNAAGVAGLLMG
jgi:hypothetical protein